MFSIEFTLCLCFICIETSSIVNEKRRKSFQRWTVLKRYSDVCTFDSDLRAAVVNKPALLQQIPPLPPKVS
jgi:hypothetical protein